MLAIIEVKDLDKLPPSTEWVSVQNELFVVVGTSSIEEGRAFTKAVQEQPLSNRVEQLEPATIVALSRVLDDVTFERYMMGNQQQRNEIWDNNAEALETEFRYVGQDKLKGAWD